MRNGDTDDAAHRTQCLVQEMGPALEQYATDFTKEVVNQEGDSPFLAGQKDGVQYMVCL